MILDNDQSTDLAAPPARIHNLYEDVAVRVPSALQAPRGTIRPPWDTAIYAWRDHALFQLVENVYRVGQSSFWDHMTTILRPQIEQHRYGPRYTPAPYQGPFDFSQHLTWDGEEDEDPWEEDEDEEPQGDW